MSKGNPDRRYKRTKGQLLGYTSFITCRNAGATIALKVENGRVVRESGHCSHKKRDTTIEFCYGCANWVDHKKKKSRILTPKQKASQKRSLELKRRAAARRKEFNQKILGMDM